MSPSVKEIRLGLLIVSLKMHIKGFNWGVIGLNFRPPIMPKDILNVMPTSTDSILSLFLSAISITITIALIPCFVQSTTLDADTQVLRSFKEAIDPISISSTSLLSTWNFDVDPCETTGTYFLGVLCTVPEDNSSSRVLVIDLEGDGLEGFLTPKIGNLTELTILNLSRNRFRGPISNAIIRLRKLTSLQLSGNFFSGRLPDDLNRLKKLENLDLSQNKLSGSVPEKVSALRRLIHLCLSSNALSGKIPDLSGLWQLSTLDISSNQLYGNLPQLPAKLSTLLLCRNLISGHVSPIRRLQHLRTLDISSNRFSGSIDQEILALPEIRLINVSANLFTEIEVTEFKGRSSQLQVLDAHSNRLHGHLPVNLITYENLTAIYLGHNLFSGKIPVEYRGQIGESWRRLFLEYNFLEGTIPIGFTKKARKFKGSLAFNCLNCPQNMTLCHGGQRPASECIRS